MTFLFTAMAPCWAQGSAECLEREQDQIYHRLSSSVHYSKEAIREGHGAERAAGLLRKWFSQEITSDAGPCKALACLVTLTELHQGLDKSETALMGELYACVGDFSKAAKVAENPVMKGFYKAVGKLDRSASSYPTQVGALLRQENDRILSEVITEQLKTRLAGTVGPSLLANPEFLNGAPYPIGLEPHHFGYQEGLKGRFLEAWEKAWESASITTIQTLFIRRGNYLKRAEVGELDQQVSSLFQRQPDALYRVAQAPSDLASDWAPTAGKEVQIRRRMLIAKRSGREAEYPVVAEEMASHLASPRDCYEAVPVALKAKSESLLGALEAHRDTLLRYQGEGVSPDTLKAMADDVSRARGEAKEIAAQKQKERVLVMAIPGLTQGPASDPTKSPATKQDPQSQPPSGVNAAGNGVAQTTLTEQLKNLTYRSPGLAIRLKDGHRDHPKEEDFPTGFTQLDLEHIAIPDHASGAGLAAAVVLQINGGGTAVINQIHAIRIIRGAPKDVGYASLGAGGIRSLSVDGTDVRVSMLVYGPDDPGCCPTVEKSLTFTFRGTALVPKATDEEVLDLLQRYEGAVTNRAAFEMTIALDPMAAQVSAQLNQGIQRMRVAEQEILKEIKKFDLLRDPRFQVALRKRVADLNRTWQAASSGFGTASSGQQKSVLVIGQVEEDLKRLLIKAAK
jgi:hypothetical protein